MANSDTSREKLSSIKTEILVAFIFAIILLVIWVIAGLSYIFTFISLATMLGPYGMAVFAVFDLILGIVFFIFMIPTILVFRRIYQLHSAANRGDIVRLKELNSIGWAVVALIFAGVIPGVMLLVAHSSIEQLSTMPLKAETSMMDLERLSKLKSLVDSGVITKAEFESQKDLLLHPSNAQPANTLEAQLSKLKSLYDSGAITKAEYDQQKEKLLRRL